MTWTDGLISGTSLKSRSPSLDPHGGAIWSDGIFSSCLGWVSAEQGIRFGKGGTVTPLGPQIKITHVRAEHSSEVTRVDPTTKKTHT